MKTVIFAGGLGTRISEESYLKPKPMIEVGGRPILWHIMKLYEHFGHDEFIICLGYKGYAIKEYFLNYFLHNSDLTIDLASNDIHIHKKSSAKFKITLVDTLLNTKTAGRLKRIEKYIDEDNFFLTYGDGVANVDINKLKDFHFKNNKICTVTAVQTEGKFGALDISDNSVVREFKEKPKGDQNWINGGFFVLNKKVFDYLPKESDDIMWEDYPLDKLATDKELVAYKHDGFWKCMDAMRDKVVLEDMWKNDPKWKLWT